MVRAPTPHQTTPFDTTLWRRQAAKAVLPLLLILAMLAGARPHAASATNLKVLDQLLNDANNPNNAGKYYRVIVTRATADQAPDVKLKALGDTKIKDVASNSFVALVKAKDVATLGADSSVKYVAPDAQMVGTGGVDSSKLATLYPMAQNAAALWSSSNGNTPLTGAGIGVAVLDTGIASLPDFNDASGKSRIAAKVLFNSNTSSMSDGHGHGTHVAGIIAGNSWRNGNTAVQGKYVGVAPDANLINVKVSDETGQSYVSDVVNAIDWVINNRTAYNIRVLNLSMVSGTAESYQTSQLDAAVEKAWLNGIMVVVAAGNSGANTMQYPPANDPFVITVGASDPMDTATQGDDQIAPWSSYGATQDGFNKPEVVATGRYMISTLASGGCTLAKTFPDRIVDSTYIRMSGTSMAAPVISGLGALAFQAHPEWSNDQVKWLLVNTATPLGTNPGTTTTSFVPYPGSGSGEVGAMAVTSYGLVPQYSNQGLTISPLLVGPNGSTTYTAGTTTASSTWATSTWATSTWATSTWATANTSTSTWATSTWASSTWAQ